jgi:P4 family phage/plasmid primase-like protien
LAIQVLGLRDRTDQPSMKREVFFTKGWRFEKIQDVFDSEKLDRVLKQIPDIERFNLYFTEADCFEERGRKLKEQWAIPFDIDDIFIESEETIQRDAKLVAEEAINVLGLSFSHCPVVFSGNGVQFHVLLDAPILSDDFFHALRPHYTAVCEKIQARLTQKGIKGRVDTSVFSAARLMRLPDTDNRKPGKPTRRALLINSASTQHAFDLMEVSGLKHVETNEVLPNEALKNYPKPDTQAVCDGCAFLKHCKTNPQKVVEPQWYAMLSITSRLDNGRDLSHEYSQGHPGYNHYETEHKIDQALNASGPRTCKNIDAHWQNCKSCDNYEKVVSPILLRGPNYIASTDYGYRTHKLNDEGRIVLGKPAYQDLIKKFGLEKPFKILTDSEQVCAFDGVKWNFLTDTHMKAWMTDIVRPEPSSSEMGEFIAQIKARNVVEREWFMETTNQKLNFKNCVLDTTTGEVTPHKPEYGFFNVLPFDYDKRAECPTWDKFLKEICNDDAGMVEVLEEFAGYCISGDAPWLEKALLMVGEGANGKSTFMETLGNVVGPNNRASVPFRYLEDDTKRYLIVNKLFNYSEETSSKALFESENFKNLIPGGVMTVKQLYMQPYEVKNRAKFIMAANEMPYSADKSHGFLRRLLIVKLGKRFTLGEAGHDPKIKEKLNTELAGICNSLIRAYERLKERGRLTDKYDNALHVKEYMIESNNVSRFFRDCVEVDNFKECKAGDLYQAYVGYCEDNGEKPFANNKFIKLLQKEVSHISVAVTKINGRTVRVYRGITVPGQGF